MYHISDVLVLGSGLAGLSYALKVADFATVNLVTKREVTETSTRMAQGGIAAVLSPEDKFEYHIQDTLTVGEGLSHPDIVGMVVEQGPERIQELVTLGAHFDIGVSNGFDLAREGGHSHRRIIHAHDMTGAEVERILVEKAQAHPNIRIFEDHMGVDLVTREKLVRRGGVHRRPAAFVRGSAESLRVHFAGLRLFLRTTPRPHRGIRVCRQGFRPVDA